MSFFDNAKADLRSLVSLVRESATYCAHIHVNPALATPESQAKEITRALRIVELEARYGLHGR